MKETPVKPLPKIARDRLAAGARLTVDSRVDAELHLDANLMAAFVEQALLPAERTMALQHLASCEACRAQIRLVQRATVVDPARNRPVPAAQSIERPWWMPGWEATAAVAGLALVAVAVSVCLRLPPHAAFRASIEMARNTPPEQGPSAPGRDRMPERKRQAPTAVAANVRPQSAASPNLGSMKQDLADSGSLELRADLARAGSSSAGPAIEPAPPREAVLAPAAPPAKAASGGINVAQSTNPPPASIGAQAAASKAAAPSNGTQTFYIPRDEASAPPTVLNLSEAERRKAPLMHVSAFRSVEPGARWAVADAAVPGTVEQSVDGGRTWVDVMVETGVPLRAVFALGQNVWAGGKAGALFHSSDGGQHWSAVNVSGAGAKLGADIIAIQFDAPAHGSVTGSNGERWTTSDGGQNWQLEH